MLAGAAVMDVAAVLVLFTGAALLFVLGAEDSVVAGLGAGLDVAAGATSVEVSVDEGAVPPLASCALVTIGYINTKSSKTAAPLCSNFFNFTRPYALVMDLPLPYLALHEEVVSRWG
jgi:hypothetical protein